MPFIRTCRISGKEFTITDQEISLLEKLSPIIGWEKFPLPLPTLCPEERLQRKFPFRNHLSLFRRTDSETGESLISSYPPDSTYTIYSQPHWWSDTWNPLDYGRVFSSEKTITEQIATLWHDVPTPALDNAYLTTENSDYINGCGPSKDCYLTSNSAYNERCLYGWFIFHSSNILDSNYITNCEYCSHSQHLWKCYGVHYSWDVSECRDSRYIFSCQWSQNLLGCVGLKNQKYQIFNTPCTHEEFENTVKKLAQDRVFRKDFESRVQNLIQKVWLEPCALTGSVDSTGDFCYDSKNAYESYNIGDCEDILYITDSFNTRDSAHISMWWDRTTLSYDSIDIGLNVSNIYFSTACWEWSRYNFYSHKCNNCQYLFGCSWLRGRSYCIFNTQYTKNDWEEMVQKIIRQMQTEWTWWEFLDPTYAPFAYNESLGDIFAPISREVALSRWYRWSDREDVPPEGITKIIPGDRLPDTITWIPDDVLQWAIQCTKTGKLFQIQPLELEMLRRFSTPIPRIHPIERIKMRLLWDRREFSFDF